MFFEKDGHFWIHRVQCAILLQLEEEKRRRKIEMWDSMQEGKSYKRNARGPQVILDFGLVDIFR